MSAALIALLMLAPAAKGPVLHKVGTDGETYAAIADHYYGKRYLERHLRLFNRKAEPLKKGTTILIPTYRWVAPRPGTTVQDFAKSYLNDAERAGYVAALHGLKRDRLPRGKRLRVVQSLPHTVRPGESLSSIAQTYYRESGAGRLKLLRLYNKLKSDRPRVGMRLRIPLDGKEFAYKRVIGRRARPFDANPVESTPKLAAAPEPASKKARGKSKSARRQRRERARAEAARAEQNLETAERLFDDGQYDECASFTEKALADATDAPKASRIEMLRVSAFAMIALDRFADARRQFKDLLELSPKYELDLYRTSPKILDVFQSVAER